HASIRRPLRPSDRLPSLQGRRTRPEPFPGRIRGAVEVAMAPTSGPPLPIDVVSDVVCPWCYIGKRRLERAIPPAPDVPGEVRWHPYFLNPWVPRGGMTRGEYLTTKFGSVDRYRGIAQRVAAAAAEEGLVYAADKIARQPNTLDCHRLILWAANAGAAGPMKQRLMELYFAEGADLSDPDVLAGPPGAGGLHRALGRPRP